MSNEKSAANLHDSPLADVKAGMDLCVHCGFCLQACPTYLALEDENDSPRGRIVLMHALLDGDISVSDEALHTHIDRCLGCRGCETACPSGVPFGHLLEATRATLREEKPAPAIGRLMLAVFANPALLRIAMFFGRIMRGLGVARLFARLPGRMGSAAAMLASTTPSQFSRHRRPRASHRHPRASGDPASFPETPAADAVAGSVVLFEGCVMRHLFGHVHDASRSTLVRNGYRLSGAPGQGCCGALHAHSGDLERARELARANIAAFQKKPADHIAVNAAGCGAMLKEYGYLLQDDNEWAQRARDFSARVADITELLEARGPVPGNKVSITAAYDAPCHLQHAQRITAAPQALFRSIPGLVLVQTPDSDKCCGAAGIYNLIEPETSAAVLAPKLRELDGSGADVVCTGNPGCMMQIGAGLLQSGSAVPVVHPVELLDYSYRNG